MYQSARLFGKNAVECCTLSYSFTTRETASAGASRRQLFTIDGASLFNPLGVSRQEEMGSPAETLRLSLTKLRYS